MNRLSPRTPLILRDMPSRPKDNPNHCQEDIAESSFRRVSRYQFVQIVLLTLAFVLSTGACLTLGYANFVLNPDCVLFARWTGHDVMNAVHPAQHKWPQLSSNNTTSVVVSVSSIESGGGWLLGEQDSQKSILDLNQLEVKWGRKRHCYVTQYGFAAAAVASFILCWFFVFFRPTREAYFLKKKTAASKLVIPAIVFCVAFVVCVLVAAITLQMGLVSWCETVSDYLSRCAAIRSYAVSWAGKTTYVDFYSVLLAGLVLSWMAALIWLANLITLSKRLYHHVDFPEYFFRSGAVNHHENVVQSETDSD